MVRACPTLRVPAGGCAAAGRGLGRGLALGSARLRGPPPPGPARPSPRAEPCPARLRGARPLRALPNKEPRPRSAPRPAQRWAPGGLRARYPHRRYPRDSRAPPEPLQGVRQLPHAGACAVPGTSGVLAGEHRSRGAARRSAASENARQDVSKMKSFAGADLGLKVIEGGELSEYEVKMGTAA